MRLKKFPYTATPEAKATAARVLAIEADEVDAVRASGRISLGAKGVKKLRQGLGLTQKAFAQVLQVELSAVESWEQGRRVPDRPVTALMLMIAEHPETKEWLLGLTKALQAVQAA